MVKVLNLIGEFLVDKLKEELTNQGHSATGELIDSIHYTIQGDSKVIVSTPKVYAKAMENGLPKEHWVPIDALIEWVEVKGIATGEEEIKNAAYAIRQNIYKYGSPTKGAMEKIASISNNGRRIGFTEYVMDEYMTKVLQMASKEIGEEATQPIFNAVKEIR